MRFFGEVGYGESTETSPGVWEDVITEIAYRGDVNRDSRRLDGVLTLNDNLVLVNTISIVADQHAFANFLNIRYVVWEGVRWKINSVEVRPPRLNLTLGEVYNGPTP